MHRSPGFGTAVALLLLLLAPPAGVGQGSPDADLLAAAEIGDLQAARSAHRLGASPNAAQPNGPNALMIASERSFLPLVRLLLDRGADLGLRDIGGLTALGFAAKGGR